MQTMLLARAASCVALVMLMVACGGEDSDTTAGGGNEETAPAPPAGGTIAVQAQEYAFVGVPTEIAAGETTFTLENIGKEFHEMVIFRIKTDASAEELLRLPQKKAEKQVEEVGGTFAKPGATAKKPIEADLEPGRYAMVCFVSVGTTPENKNAKGPPHFTEGMFVEFTAL